MPPGKRAPDHYRSARRRLTMRGGVLLDILVLGAAAFGGLAFLRLIAGAVARSHLQLIHSDNQAAASRSIQRGE
jgi:hypothetical protein